MITIQSKQKVLLVIAQADSVEKAGICTKMLNKSNVQDESEEQSQIPLKQQENQAMRFHSP